MIRRLKNTTSYVNGAGMIYTDFGNMDSGDKIGNFDIIQNAGVIKLRYTPNANTAVTVQTLTTMVGIATTATGAK